MRFLQETLTIANGATQSSSVEIRGSMLVAIAPDSDFDGALLTLETSFDEESTWRTVQDDAGADVTVTVAASELARLVPDEFTAFELLCLVSNAAQVGGGCSVEVFIHAE